MKPGTRVVSHSFLMDDWQPDQRSMTEHGNAYLWIVPAKVAGTWSFRQQDGSERGNEPGNGPGSEPGNGNFVVQLEQKFQQLSGCTGDHRQLLSDAHVRGPQIDLAFIENGAPTRVTGRLDGERIDATVTRGKSTSRYIGTRVRAGNAR